MEPISCYLRSVVNSTSKTHQQKINKGSVIMDPLPDLLQELSEERQSLLRQFRSQVADIRNPVVDDYFLLRFLKARKFDVDKAEKMLREHMKFRKNIGLDTMLTDYRIHEVADKHFPRHILGCDRDGDVVVSLMIGQTDFKGIFSSITVLEGIKCMMCYLETALKIMEDENKNTGRKSEKFVILVDCAGLQVRQILDRTVGRQLIDYLLVFEANYPERLKVAYVINAPTYFFTWFAVFKMFADFEIIRKVQLYSTGGWQDELVKRIDPDILPAMFGGNLTDPDGNPNCCTIYNYGGKVPVSYYIKSRKSKFVRGPDMIEVTVRERTYYNHQVYVKSTKSIIRWFFQTMDNNISFAIYYVPNSVKPMPKTSMPKFSKSFRHRVRRNSKDGHDIVVPPERVESHVIPEQGEIVCERTGTYLLHFDNTFSWMTPKQLNYKVQVLPPSEPVLGLIAPNRKSLIN